MSGWLQRLRDGLAKSSRRLTTGIAEVFTRQRLDDQALEALEDLLVTADLGVATAGRLTAALAKDRFDKEVDGDEVRAVLADQIAEILAPAARPLTVAPDHRPHVILFVGVNGSGKTTTIGKFAQKFHDEGRRVMLAAGDTFRAAAVEQLQVWGDRVGVPVIAGAAGADAAAVAFQALAAAREAAVDVLLIDTAGRLQNKRELMDELAKINRVIAKQDPAAPHDRVLVLDGTVGQNAHGQVEAFQEVTEVSGLIVTKLDGSARGGVVVALTEKFGLPVHAIGVGEGVEDLQPFDAADFARNLLGLGEARARRAAGLTRRWQSTIPPASRGRSGQETLAGSVRPRGFEHGRVRAWRWNNGDGHDHVRRIERQARRCVRAVEAARRP